MSKTPPNTLELRRTYVCKICGYAKVQLGLGHKRTVCEGNECAREYERQRKQEYRDRQRGNSQVAQRCVICDDLVPYTGRGRPRSVCVKAECTKEYGRLRKAIYRESKRS